ncbi:hypothetical protein M406DRAFT_71499 [Cryphonectria parasitica EP155]|uniref:Uncharacterized protein n=1 Tax=Cryphonectria parasitica (strain ATCC 38755 / EP155) TaxID=660469 RepID=A0A9P5CSM4_CRYP1|nr:uncharacterized protein M406DRAFT_71499 [Cryphonectria parasitica EP155]KAF3768501.1 hypothetical protein M406DRAFT_71499 [Cryphonectria parasitica EP155]
MRKNIQTVNDLVRAAEGTVQKKEESLRKAEDNSKTLMETLKKHEADSIAHEAEARQMEEQLRDSRKNESVLRGERELAAEQLREKTEMLDEINNWRLQMKKIDETERDETATKLQGLFTEAYSMVKKYFGDDVPDQIGKDAKAWEALRGHVAVSHPYKIPLPSSNSPQAKQMRVAAVLAVLGHHLAEQILQPLFILEDGGELNEFLSELASDDPPREAFLRSTLLAALTSADQRENRQERVKDVFQAVISAAQPLLADGKRDGFRRALRDLCARYCETWSEIQHLEDKIEWSLDVDEPDNFELLQLPNPAGETASEATSNNQASGTPKTGSNRPPNSSVSQLSRPSSNTASQLRGNEAIVAPVWPCFILTTRTVSHRRRDFVGLEGLYGNGRDLCAPVKRFRDYFIDMANAKARDRRAESPIAQGDDLVSIIEEQDGGSSPLDFYDCRLFAEPEDDNQEAQETKVGLGILHTYDEDDVADL